MAKIYRIGTLGRSQAARREDGQWFVRDRIRTPFGNKWLRWSPVAARPDHAWYCAGDGEARLPQTDSYQQQGVAS
jgi:hypothetical protein